MVWEVVYELRRDQGELVCCKKKMVFFFKQKTAYEVRLSLVGSEMCIRNSLRSKLWALGSGLWDLGSELWAIGSGLWALRSRRLYTSDASDE